jgi:diguanylate cyclase (GGDEF)-like protein
MEQRSPTLREKLARLRRSYLASLPASLERAEGLCAQLAAAVTADKREAALEGLFHIFHTIKGSGASFRLQEISTAAAEAETLVGALRRGEAGDPGALGGVLARLRALGTAADVTDKTAPPAEPEAAPRYRNTQLCRRVYVCDDEPGIGEQLEAQLSCFGYAVSVFQDPASLHRAVMGVPPDVVIMDIMFPDRVSGTDVVAALHSEMAVPPPVVFLSTERGFTARLKAVQAGGQAYFVKPIKVTDLVDTLDALTARHDPEPYRVLVIDDEPAVAGYHSAILEQAGMVTRLLHDPAEILEALSGFKPDLVLMDMYMPQCSGRDLSRLIRQIPEFVSLPIVFLSSETDKLKQVSALRVGAEGFLTKPIQPDDLIAAVAIRAERMRTLRSLMVRDSLTGLFNHTFLSQFLETALANAKRNGNRLCFVMIDVDHFKKVNDSYGHPAGDQVLVALSRLLQQRLRDSDMVGRYGGEEFALVMQNVSAAEALAVVDEIRGDFAKVGFRSGDTAFSCTFSAGIAAFPPVQGAEALTEAADRALYAAKHAGRNRVVGPEES